MLPHIESRYVYLNPPFRHTEIILFLSSFDLAVLVFVVHMVSTKILRCYSEVWQILCALAQWLLFTWLILEFLENNVSSEIHE